MSLEIDSEIKEVKAKILAVEAHINAAKKKITEMEKKYKNYDNIKADPELFDIYKRLDDEKSALLNEKRLLMEKDAILWAAKLPSVSNKGDSTGACLINYQCVFLTVLNLYRFDRGDHHTAI